MTQSTMFNSKLNVFIPSVHFSVSQKQIMKTFYDLEIGQVSCVLLLPKRNKKFNSAYIYFDTWFDDSIVSKNFQEKVLDPTKKAKVVYNDPDYWIVEPLLLTITNTNTKKNQSQATRSFYEKRLGMLHEEIEEDIKPNMEPWTEEDYMRMEDFEIAEDEREVFEDFDKILADGLTKEDVDRCEEYFNCIQKNTSRVVSIRPEFFEPYPFYV